MSIPIAEPRFERTPHLVGLIAQAERIAARITGADATRRAVLAKELLPRAVVASLQLDGSPISAPPEIDQLPETSRGAWFDPLGYFHEDETGMVAVEFANGMTSLSSEALGRELLTDPLGTLHELYATLTTGLVDEAVLAGFRKTDQAVQDTSVGRIIFFPIDPSEIDRQMHLLAAWLQTAAAREHPLIVSGVLQHRLLHIHPWEAANGRVARTAARLLLRDKGLDPDGVVTVEAQLVRDRIGYYDEAARTIRRGDLTIWLERWSESVVAAARDAARALDVLPADIPDRAAAFLATWPTDAFTIADYRATASVGPQESAGDMEAALDANLVTRVPGSRGLRFVRTTPEQH